MGKLVRAFKKRSWTKIIIVASVFMTGLAAKPTLQAESSTGIKETIPDLNEHLSRAELRWCTFEPIRLDGESREILNTEEWEIDQYNARARVRDKHCLHKMYLQKDKTIIERELTPNKINSLRQAGILRIQQARAERETRRFFVKEEVAKIWATPSNDTGAILGQVLRWGELITTGRRQGPWYEVEWNSPSLDATLKYGWVIGELVEHGSGVKARFVYCEKYAGQRALHNEIVRGQIDNNSVNRIRIENGLEKDAYIKLVNQYHEVVLTFLVGAQQTAVVNGVPLGSYEILYATGSMFSRGCDSFSQRGIASRFTQRVDYNSHTQGWRLTLHKVSDGNAQTNLISYDDFDRL
ncbi:MAG: hypothetical protein OXK72_05355 [Gammaproteobacteria bacterium]|nr:hypothetical protein [Gammaproteobacteria bacterium]